MGGDAGPTIDRADAAEAERFRCHICQQTFGRVEHLTRHSWSHSKERYLKCSYCHKGFYRGDALRRHEQVHRDTKRSCLGRGVRACLACAKARRKCSGDNPCSACEKRSIDCSYPHSKNVRRKSTVETADRDPLLSPHEQSTELWPGHGLASSQVTASPQDTTGSWSNISHSPVVVDQENGGLGLSAPGSGYGTNEGVMTPGVIEATAFQGVRRDSLHTAMQPHLSLGSQPNILNDSGEISVVTPLSPFLRSPMTDFQRGVSSETSLTWPSRVGTSHSMKVNVNMDLSRRAEVAEPNFWSQNGLSSINWLPEDWIPDFDFGTGGLSPQNNDSNAMQMQTTQALSMMGVPEVGSAASKLNGKTPPVNSEHGIASPESSETTQSAGYYYVDGDGARLPRVRKAPQRSPHQSSDPYTPLTGVDGQEDSLTQLEFPGTDYRAKDSAAISLAGNKQIPIEVYSEILHVFGQTCVKSTYFSPYNSGDFPSLESLGLFVRLYMEHFQPILPFIHPATFNLSSSHWLLTLAMAAIGSHYVDTEHVEVLVVSMHEFLRRAIHMMTETGNSSRANGLVMTQIRLLSCVGMLYCGDQRLVERAKASASDLIGFCATEWARCIGQDDQTLMNIPSNQTASDWEAWCHAESHRRTGYSIWLLDCTWRFQFQLRPLLSLEDAKVPVPCQEVLWEADTALDWQQLYSCSTQNPSLHEVVQILYIEKRLQSSMGEFSRILCIHALFRRTWEVEAYFKQPLTLWSPAAEKQDIKSRQTSNPVWLPGIQTYSRWRNSACDCLDILHWHANSVIGAASGMEHPTVLHLHLARVVLLTPICHIVQLAHLMTEERGPNSEAQIAETRSFVRRWAREDQHKARLAMIHAGMVFWHVRRYSTDAFYEPSAVLHATLAMWAYGTFALNTSGLAGGGTSPQDDDDAETLFPTSMQLDRPADDELVQLFVRQGGLMRANVTRVGNLCSARGPGRVLLEGRNLLVDLKCWRDSRKAVRTLARLSEVCQRGQSG